MRSRRDKSLMIFNNLNFTMNFIFHYKILEIIMTKFTKIIQILESDDRNLGVKI